MEYHAGNIEKKWKKYWVENNIYKIENDVSKPKFYVLDMFPYPSGSGLHVGHPLGYIASDIIARCKRMQGFNVLHPMGFDAFGLPAEQFAIQSGVHPADSTRENIQRYKNQLDNLGLNYDWSRKVETCEPSYYKWTQWIFLKLYYHYYDTGAKKATPIAKLIETFEQSGNLSVQAFHNQEFTFDANHWKNMSAFEKDEILMNYRLAYRKVGYVNWCEELGTVLANDEVKDGVSERGGHPVERKAMRQWSLRITAYAERLLDDLDTIDWSDALKTMQRNWIGRSEGAQMFFDIDQHEEKLEIFTTRSDTIFGATFMVLAPEHELVSKLTTETQKTSIEDYKKYVTTRSERDRMAEVKEVTGAFTGSYAINPFTDTKIPIWISEYVLKDYGTGAIMAVPSDDDRDFAFATKFGLEIIDIIDKSKYPGADRHDKLGIMINSGFLNGMEVPDAIEATLKVIEDKKLGKRQVNYKLRDANFSRQRYWGEPFPIYYDDEGVSHALELEDLPLTLPELDDFKPASGGRSPLARLTDWVNPEKGITRETDTMPGYAGSSWYFLRYMDAGNPDSFCSPEAVNYWQDVDLYIGGTEHAVGHLMYSRFWHKFLFDKGLVPTNEPFKRLINQGMIQGVIEFIYLQKEKDNGFPKFLCAGLAAKETDTEFVKIPIHVDFVENYGSKSSYLSLNSIKKFLDWRPEYQNAIFECSKGIYHLGKFNPKKDGDTTHLVTVSEVGKMSKRYFNTVNPDDVVHDYGADCFRMYEMFLGPIEQSKPWDTRGIDGVSKFLRKYWSLFFNEEGKNLVTKAEATEAEKKLLHATIKKVTADIERLSFNTAVSSFMICVNELKKLNCNKLEVLEPLNRLIAPFAPFTAEELWTQLGHEGSIHHADYPKHDESLLVESEIEYPVSINGKRRMSYHFPANASMDDIKEEVVKIKGIQKWIEGKQIIKIIVVTNRMVNIVVK
jgi:leucyl-tRNA synthetase